MEKITRFSANESELKPNIPYRVAAWAVSRVVKTETTGDENIPQGEPYIVAYTHHSSYWDPLVVGVEIYKKTGHPIRYMTKQELFFPPLSQILKSLGAFPVNRDEFDPTEMGNSVDLLRSSQIIAIAPEGTRIYDEKIAKLKRGVGMLACIANVKVLPVGIAGHRTKIPIRGTAIVPPLALHFSEPIKPPADMIDFDLNEVNVAQDLPRQLIRPVRAFNTSLKISLQQALDAASQNIAAY